MNVADKVILITGAAGGMGHIVAARFAQAGASLALVDRASDRLDEQCGDLVDAHDVILIGGIDATKEEDAERMVSEALDHFGQVDVLINIAGGYRAGDPVHETSLSTWEFMMALNAKSVFISSGAVIPHMVAQGGGKIINIGAKPGFEASANHSAYGASKSAVMRLTEAIAKEYGGDRIWANAIIPQIIDTPANREAMPNADHSRWVTPEQIADVLIFLASPASDAISGALIPVYGRALV